MVISTIVIVLSILGLYTLDEDIEGARIFPILCFVTFIALGALLIAQNMIRKGWASSDNAGWCSLPDVPWKGYLFVGIVYIIYITSIQWIGFVLSSFIFIFIIVIFTGKNRQLNSNKIVYLKYVAFSILATCGIYFLFIRILNLSLPMQFMDLFFA
jgi:ABC-type Fe3+-siderophore transport system permease subunit